MVRLNSKQLRDIPEEIAQTHAEEVKRNPLILILENVYDTYNIGGLFRLADALAVQKMYLCGEMETPPNHRILKASVGTYKIVPWEYKATALEAISAIRSTSPGTQICAVEQSDKSVPYTNVDYSAPVALLVGNETFGVLPETLDLVDTVVEIPMWGINKSLNVIVSAGIVSYHVMKQLSDQST